MALRNTRQWLRLLSPPWLSKPNGYGVRYVEGLLGYFADMILSAASQAVRVSSIRLRGTPTDAYAETGDNFDIQQVPGETPAAYRNRLATTWTLWAEAATGDFAENAVAPFGVDASDVTIYTSATWTTPHDNWSRFWIVLGPTDDLPWNEATWGGDPWDLWGSTGTWGSDATLTTIGGVLGQINKFKSAHEVGVAVILLFAGGAIYGHGTWGAPRLWDVNSVVKWPMGRFWGEDFNFKVWGDVEPYRPTLPAVYGGKIRI